MKQTRIESISVGVLVVSVALIAGCEGRERARIGEFCEEEEGCGSGLCYEEKCLSPDEDTDGDGMLNGVEKNITHTDYGVVDTDADGVDDGSEVGDVPSSPKDSDGDGIIDALESSLRSADKDRDCIPDQFDPHNDEYNDDMVAVVKANCLIEGACHVGISDITAYCRDGVPSCDYSMVSGYQEVESLCDGVDNDCDGETDEGLEAPSDMTCPSVGVCAEEGVEIRVACLSGKWACDYSSVRGWEAEETLCDGLDNDCDGETDEGLSGPDCPDQPCVPDCGLAECGPDPVCGTSCGECGDGYTCQSGTCEKNACVPDCGLAECGPDPVCGMSCGECGDGYTCLAGTCEKNPCVPDCSIAECGPDPVCGTSCGECGDGYTCQSGICEKNACVPDCGALECGPDPVCGTSCGECDDGDVCTVDECNGLGCIHTPSLDACDDNNLCTVDDMCTSDLICVGTPVSCSDNNPCTDDGCVDGEWTYTSNFGICDDDDACTENDKCDASGNCVGAVVTCDDGDICTTGSCDREAGCSYTISVTCDDSDVCTHDFCDPVLQCQYVMEPEVDCGTQECGLSVNGCWWCGNCPAGMTCGSDLTCVCPIGYQGENCDSCADGYTGYPECFLPAVQVVAGNDFTCELTTVGGVRCWGKNEYGQLGNGTTVSTASPVDVTGLSSGVRSLAAGYGHACALMDTGGLKCWGYNASGQAGDGTKVNKLIPTQVSGLASGVTAVSVGNYHTCALLGTGGVKCWGYNSYGQLGDGTTTIRTAPTQVSGLASGVTAVSVGNYHTCALLGTGGVKCWGYNYSGQIGDGTTDNKTTPTQVSGLESGVAALAAGDDTSCAILASGASRCWGYNGYGQIGDGTTDNKTTPTVVSGLESGIAALAVGSHMCALLDSGVLKCWGYNYYGQVGDGTTDNRSVPTGVSGIEGLVVSVSSGGNHTCALLDSGKVMCWGSNSSGQLGSGYVHTMGKNQPVDVMGLQSGVKAISVGPSGACALLDDGGVKCWGSTPVSVVGLDGTAGSVSAVSVGEMHRCALMGTGGVKCWGSNGFGQLGDGTTVNKTTPTQVSGLESGVTSISAGPNHTCALLESGGVKCWGYNSYGELGDGTTTTSSVPIDVSGLGSGVRAISAGQDYNCALMDDETVRCWGRNGSGQLGDGTVVDSPVPVAVQGLGDGTVSISAGHSVTCSLLVDGTAKCWGACVGGCTPSPVTLLHEPVTAFVTGHYFACVVTEAGATKCWGLNSFGELGDGTYTEKEQPVDVVGLSSGVAAIDCVHGCCALTTEGAVKCWGKNDVGQLGDGTAWSTVPLSVVN